MSFKDLTKNTEQSFDKIENKAHDEENKMSIKPDKSKQTSNINITEQVEEAPISRSKSSSMKNLLSSITGGGMGSKSPDPSRRNSGSLFGSLLRKSGKGSRSGSRQSSVERGSQYLGSEDERRSTSRVSDIGSDGGSENSMVMKLKKLTKKKPPKVKTTDFDELFARGMAKSAQLDLETNKEKQICRNENISRLEHQTKEKSPPISSEEKFLAKVTEFVAKYDFVSKNKVRPAVESNRLKQETTDTKRAIQGTIELNSVSTPNKIEEKLPKKYAAPE